MGMCLYLTDEILVFVFTIHTKIDRLVFYPYDTGSTRSAIIRD